MCLGLVQYRGCYLNHYNDRVDGHIWDRSIAQCRALVSLTQNSKPKILTLALTQNLTQNLTLTLTAGR